jgi:MSHA biogenesis protein MshQ
LGQVALAPVHSPIFGQPFNYVTTPQATITARNAAGVTTANYTGALWKIGGATSSTAKDCLTSPDANTCQFTTSLSVGSNSSNAIEKYIYTLVPVNIPNWDSAGATAAAASVTAGTGPIVSGGNGIPVGTGTITYASSDTLAFLRSTTAPQANFTASITDTISVADTSEASGTITTTTPAAFSSIAFDAGNVFYYGRLKLSNANGSELLNLPIPVQTQYWNGTTFITNSADNCTTLIPGNIKLTAPLGVSATVGGAFSSGVGSLTP